MGEDLKEKSKIRFFLKESAAFLLDILYNAVVIILLVVLIRSFIISPFRVVGSSMADTLQSNNFIIIDKISYILGDVDRGDPIVFLPPVTRKQSPKFDETVLTDGEGVGTLTISDLSKPKETTYCENVILKKLWFCQDKVREGDLVFAAPVEKKLYSSAIETNWDKVEKFFITKEDVNRGEIAISGDPEVKYTLHIYPSTGSEYFVKRVLGIAGDEIKIDNGRVYLKRPEDSEFYELDETYLSEENMNQTYILQKNYPNTFTVPEGHFFVLGDNRNHSNDSRSWISPITQEPSPFVTEEDISGRVLVVLFPLNGIRLVQGADFE